MHVVTDAASYQVAWLLIHFIWRLTADIDAHISRFTITKKRKVKSLKFQKRPLITIHNVDNSDLVANCGNPELTS